MNIIQGSRPKRIQKINGTFRIGLPKDWCEQLDIEAEDDVYLDLVEHEKQVCILVSTKNPLEKKLKQLEEDD